MNPFEHFPTVRISPNCLFRLVRQQPIVEFYLSNYKSTASCKVKLRGGAINAGRSE